MHDIQTKNRQCSVTHSPLRNGKKFLYHFHALLVEPVRFGACSNAVSDYDFISNGIILSVVQQPTFRV